MSYQSSPNYKAIYADIIMKKKPHRKDECLKILTKSYISTLDIIALDKLIFGNSNENDLLNQKYRSYRKKDILEILNYQIKNDFNNSQLAKHFGISRNTVAKWKRWFF